MISAMQREFVLVHGMSHGGWAWDEIARRLERDGHRVIAPDLPGHGRRAGERGRASIAAYARAVADAAIQAGFSRSIVVGHSMGGVVIPKGRRADPRPRGPPGLRGRRGPARWRQPARHAPATGLGSGPPRARPLR
jgi:hypothetical protein